MVKRVIQYFCFLDRLIKGGDIFDFYKGGILPLPNMIWVLFIVAKEILEEKLHFLCSMYIIASKDFEAGLKVCSCGITGKLNLVGIHGKSKQLNVNKKSRDIQ